MTDLRKGSGRSAARAQKFIDSFEARPEHVNLVKRESAIRQLSIMAPKPRGRPSSRNRGRAGRSSAPSRSNEELALGMVQKDQQMTDHGWAIAGSSNLVRRQDEPTSSSTFETSAESQQPVPSADELGPEQVHQSVADLESQAQPQNAGTV